MHTRSRDCTIGRLPGHRRRRARVTRAVLCATLCALLALGVTAVRAAPGDLEIAVLPSLSTRASLETYRPLREYLEHRLARPVVIITAPDYRTLIERTRRGDYRYVITAPHFARLAQLDSGYEPLVGVRSLLAALLVVPRDGGITGIEGLRGKVVAAPDRLALVSMLGHGMLRAKGLVPGTDVEVRAYPSLSSALLAVTGGAAQAAITARSALNQMPDAIDASMTTLERSATVPHIMLIASPEAPAAERARLASALLAFARDPRGARFFERTGFEGYVTVDAGILRRLDPFVDQLRRELTTP